MISRYKGYIFCMFSIGSIHCTKTCRKYIIYIYLSSCYAPLGRRMHKNEARYFLHVFYWINTLYDSASLRMPFRTFADIRQSPVSGKVWLMSLGQKGAKAT